MGPPGVEAMGRQVDELREVLQVLQPLGGIGGLDPGSLAGPELQAAGVLMWDLVGAGAGGYQLGVQGLKGAADPAGLGAAATGVPGVGGQDLAVEGRLKDRESAVVRTLAAEGLRLLGLLGSSPKAGTSLTLWRGSLLSRGHCRLLGGLAAQGQGPWGRSLWQRIKQER